MQAMKFRLQTGFHAEPNSGFWAMIEGCEGQFRESATSLAHISKEELFSIQPNPFSEYTQLSFHLPIKQKVDIQIFNLLGEKVLHPVYEKTFLQGKHEIQVQGQKLTPGVYVVVMNSLQGKQTKKAGVSQLSLHAHPDT